MGISESPGNPDGIRPEPPVGFDPRPPRDSWDSTRGGPLRIRPEARVTGAAFHRLPMRFRKLSSVVCQCATRGPLWARRFGPEVAAEKLGAAKQDPDLDGLLFRIWSD